MQNKELRVLLYEKYGAYSKKAYNIIKLACKENIKSIHELVKKTGAGFRFVRDILYTLEGYVKFDGEFITFSNINFKNEELKELNYQDFCDELNIIKKELGINKADLDHIAGTTKTCFDRAKLILDTFDVEYCNILYVGDHDLSSLGLAVLAKALGIDYHIFVADIDDDIIDYIIKVSKEKDLDIQIAQCDFRYSFPKGYTEIMDVVFTDPPYTPEGMGVFFNACILSMKNNQFSTMYICYKTAELSNMLGVHVQREINNRGLYINQIITNFNEYEQAEALGYRSDLYECRLTPKSYKIIEKVEYLNKIYTHGLSAVETKSKLFELDDIINELIPKGQSAGINLIQGNEIFEYRSSRKVNYSKRRKYIDSKMKGSSNISNNSTVIFECCGGVNEYEFRILLLSGYSDFFSIMLSEQKNVFIKSTIYKTLSYAYDITERGSKNGIIVYSFSKKSKIQKIQQQILQNMILSVRSSIKNSFVNNFTKLTKCTKNEAREMFNSFDMSNESDLCMFNMPLTSLTRMINNIMQLEV